MKANYLLRKHQDDVTCVRFLDTFNRDTDTNTDILASGDVIGDVKLWNLETRRPLHEFRPTKAQCSIPNVDYSPSRNTLITQTRSPSHGWIHGWDLNKLSITKQGIGKGATFQFDTHCSSFCRFSIVQHLENELFSPSPNYPVNEEKESKSEPIESVENDDASNQNESLLSKMMKKQNETDHVMNASNGMNDIISSNIDVSNLLIGAVGRNRALFQLWDCHRNEEVHSFDFDEIPGDTNKRGMVMNIDAFYTNQRNGMIAVIVSESGFIDIYDVRASKIMFSKRFGDNTPLTCMALNEKRSRGICAGANHKLYGFSIKYGTGTIRVRKEIDLKNEGVNIVKIRKSDQRIFGVGGWDHRTRIFNWKTMEPLCILKGHKGGITDLDFHPQKNLLATSSKDSSHISMYSVY